MKRFSSEAFSQMGLCADQLPAHVGIIMDGNGRWAQQRGLPRAMGHRAGVDRLRGIIRMSSDLGIGALSLYAFSTENWKRPEEEVGVLCGLLVEYFNREIDELHANEVCIRILGDTTRFPQSVQRAVQRAQALTQENAGLKLNIALNYGSRAELVYAARSLAREVLAQGLAPEAIDEEAIETHLYSRGLPPLDLVIRTSGEQRLSNFMLFQAAYAELMFVPEHWPDFSDECYLCALRAFQGRSRRYGGL